MTRRNWKHIQPNSLRHAMELTLEFARERKNLNVDRVAELMGLPAKWTLYKWLENGRMPSILIRPFEHACGINFMTRYLAASDHKLIIDIPTGKSGSQEDLLTLQTACNEAVNLLAKFYRGAGDIDETLTALNDVMAQIAGHRGNVMKASAPELDLFGGDE